MTKNNFFIATATVVLLLSVNLTSCIKNKSKENVVEFDKLDFNDKISLLSVNDTTLPFSEVKIEFTYPEKFNNKEDLASLQQIFTGTFFNDETYDSLSPKDALDKYIDNYSKEYRELSKDYYDAKARLGGDGVNSWYWYYLNISNNILFKDANILSYSVEYSDYTGGAHGSLRVLYYTIDLNKIATISQEDIFKPNYQKFLTSKIIEKLMEKYNLDSPDKLIEEGFFDINDISPNNNFWMNDKGVHYIYNQYEIAPYSMGPIDVSIPFEELTSIIIPESIAGKYMEKE